MECGTLKRILALSSETYDRTISSQGSKTGLKSEELHEHHGEKLNHHKNNRMRKGKRYRYRAPMDKFMAGNELERQSNLHKEPKGVSATCQLCCYSDQLRLRVRSCIN